MSRLIAKLQIGEPTVHSPRHILDPSTFMEMLIWLVSDVRKTKYRHPGNALQYETSYPTHRRKSLNVEKAYRKAEATEAHGTFPHEKTANGRFCRYEHGNGSQDLSEAAFRVYRSKGNARLEDGPQ